MSHFTEVEIKAQQVHEKEFIKALEKQFGEGSIEVSNAGLPLHGYHGDNRNLLSQDDPNYAPLCHIRILRKHVGNAANDVGFRRNGEGSYDAFISEFDSGGNFDKDKQNNVAKNYTILSSHKILKAKGYTTTEKIVKGKNGVEHVRVVGSKWV